MAETTTLSQWLDNDTLIAKDKVISSTCATANDVATAKSEAEQYADSVASQAETNAKSYTDTTKSTLQDEIDNILGGDIDLTQYIKTNQKGAAGGVVPLNDSTLIDAQYLPSYVDDVVVCDTKDDFPTDGEEDKIYVAADTGDEYRWADGAGYIQIGQNVATADEAVHAESASTADVATKLGTATVGSTTTPIYLNAGTPTTINVGAMLETTTAANVIATWVEQILANCVDVYISDSGNFTLEVDISKLGI